jgi:hypothetical protein
LPRSGNPGIRIVMHDNSEGVAACKHLEAPRNFGIAANHLSASHPATFTTVSLSFRVLCGIAELLANLNSKKPFGPNGAEVCGHG